MLKVTFLGFSNGLQAADTANTSLVVSDGATDILVDASGSPGNALLRNGYNPAALDALVLTHAHVDHLYALPSLLHCLWLMKREKPLIILGNQHTIEKAKALYHLFLLNEKRMMDISWLTSCNRIGSIDIGSFPLFHRPKVPTNGYVFSNGKKLSYFPDNASMLPYPEEAEDSDLIIHEAGGLDNDLEHLKADGHSSGAQAGELAKALRAKQLMLVHLPGSKLLRDMILEEAKHLFPDASIPENDMTISL